MVWGSKSSCPPSKVCFPWVSGNFARMSQTPGGVQKFVKKFVRIFRSRVTFVLSGRPPESLFRSFEFWGVLGPVGPLAPHNTSTLRWQVREKLYTPPPPFLARGHFSWGGGGVVYFDPRVVYFDPRARNFIRLPSSMRPPPLEGYLQGWGGVGGTRAQCGKLAF